ncbi:MAG: FtsX-like permease family protein, partial [Gemmatimonadota bacterium]
VQPGFRTEGILTATVNPPASKYGDDDAKRRYYDGLLTELETVPGIAQGGLVTRPPLTSVSNGLVDVRGGPRAGVTGYYQLVGGDYFRAMGMTLLRGRPFDPVLDHENAEHVVMVNQAFAKQAWPGDDPIGKQMTGGGMDNFWDQEKWATVIGVVSDVRQRNLTRAPAPTYYFFYRQRPFRAWSMTAILRPKAGNAGALAAPVRKAVRRLDTDVPVTFATIESRVSRAVADRRFTMMVLVFFAAVALILACVGIYGVVAYTVARRSREIGIRIALGADPASVRRLIQRGSLVPVAVGAVVGIGLAMGLTRVMRSLLYEISPADPLTFVAVLVSVGTAAWLASFIPSLRSTRVNPTVTMRAE